MNNNLIKQEIFQKLEEGIKNKQISEKELAVFFAEKTKKCYACGRKIETELEIISLEIRQDKIIAQLNNGKKPEVPLKWFAKWGVKNVTAKKLEKYEIWEGEDIYFPEIDEVLGIEKFISGFDASCK
ncbi:MAG: hypothetical protein MRECE_6c015 [Mycoplasmataceae bacterium CE_OT135]|nr:MAG: hypothetical protein MRECE_17c035 [Mycoplasmataceae bacterium CE_OT135]KLL03921.1 MAG: hypothetical protein MRECE_6c015 [Mycoplasmataceae bacterium CE_OT135]